MNNHKEEDLMIKRLKQNILKPDSEDGKLSLLKDAKTYRARDWSSKPI